MSFNATVPLQYFDLNKRIRENEYKIDSLDDELEAANHMCNCEYCDKSDTARSVHVIEEDIKSLTEENELVKDTIRRLEQYAKDKNITLSGREKRDGEI